MQIKLLKKKKASRKKNFIFTRIFLENRCWWRIGLDSFFFFFGYRFLEINQEPILPATNESEQIETVKKIELKKFFAIFPNEKKNQPKF